ncbi:MAG: SPFH domain-containing protein [Myxococcales bacterium]
MISAEMFGLWAVVVITFVVLVVATLMFLAARYKRCPSDAVLVVFGKVGEGQHANCIHGGGAFIWPLIQDYKYLSLTPMSIGIDLRNALSLQNIRINVPSTFTCGVSTLPAIMNNAAERLLGLNSPQIEEMAREIIFGQLRLTVASLTIEQINQDRESFLDSIRKNVEPELNKIGLYLINVNITDITDESNYIDSIGKKAASEAINRARVDVAEQEKIGAVGQSVAQRDREVQVAQNTAEAAKGQKAADAERRVFVQQREAEAVSGENAAQASIAKSTAELNVQKAEAHRVAEVALREAQVQIQKIEALAEKERLTASEVVRQEIERQKAEILAAAEAEQTRLRARGEADAVRARYDAEAEGVRKVLQSKAEGYRALVESCNGDPRAAASLLMIEKIEELVKAQVEAVKNLKIDKVTVWDGGAGGHANGQGSSATANFASSLIKSLPPLHEVAKMAGVELPEYLGEMLPERKGEPVVAAPPSPNGAA